ncbi:hypothetical protein C8F04DRAFT_1181655 [Mycena alexandri]|uniref:Uncharacterized protein n=1 Tax=Mycena alexandri TaxID=1745969 RepID=A0AAD6SZV6_9AGAR|nr:hypothetical protein C8F04DRAFT_1181655 [Mycena alexandri]
MYLKCSTRVNRARAAHFGAGHPLSNFSPPPLGLGNLLSDDGKLIAKRYSPQVDIQEEEWMVEENEGECCSSHALAGSGRVGVLSRYPEIVDSIKTRLADLRKSGVCIGRLLTRTIILAIIQDKCPELLKSFKCSETYSVMDWSLRHGTRAAAHLLANANKVCERTFFRLVHLINFYDIPPELIINMDQTSVMLMVANNKSFNPKGER